MNRKKGILLGGLAIIFTAFILSVVILQGNFQNTPTDAQKDSEHRHNEFAEETGQNEQEINNKQKEWNPSLKKKPEEVKDGNPENKGKTVTESKAESTVEEKSEYLSFSTKYVTVSSLNVRNGPGVDYDVAGIVKINEEVQAADSTVDGWIQIKAGKLSGYVNDKYLDDEKTAVQYEAASTSSIESKQTDEIIADTYEKENKKSEETPENNQEEKTETVTAETGAIPTNDVDKLKSIDGNNQLILVTADGYNTSSARVRTFERNTEGNWQQLLDVSGFIGKNGFADNKVEGDGKTPTGKYTIGHAFGRAGNPGTKLSYRAITPDDVWVDDSNSSLYNSWQSKSETSDKWASAENMDIPLYTNGFVINYNMSRTPGKGSAIFFHIASGHTLGCVGVSEPNVLSILKWLDPAKNPVIIQTPASGLGNY
ncbi:L,D-transpeptidase family protein [Oceanobacillus damuensis]|uniref:L,D-transpeptidase family protein n=1 Tax=Oceanobacillus damuensis TaxID=937928 RepID=UPI000832AE1E|nr:L,D-transpeptidase family protein [Oceanobacillus damuensis]